MKFKLVRASLLSSVFLSWPASAQVSFNRDIRPIMSDTCFRCHGPDKSARLMDLRLDIRDEALKPLVDGKIPIVPGKPEQSEIIRRIFASDQSEIMPPEYAHKALTQAQKETIRQWVAEGAKYEGHWSFQPIKRPPVPEVSGNRALVQNPIDAFIQARLAKEGLRPSPEADRRTLIRRATLDLTGLPPTAEEVQQFVNSKSPDAYTKLVDRLLASPRYAEMETMYWLDAVRYADSRGYHGDNPQPAWPYRDYLLRAFRDNKPFDDFTREQLAGDLIPNATTDQKVASAYNRILRTSQEGGLQDKEYLAKYGADRVRTTSAVWLGLTTGCAECHDHKFDPIKSEDFYAMKAFFADIKEVGLLRDRGEDAWTTLSLPSADQSLEAAKLDEEIKAAQRALDEKTDALRAQQAAWEEKLSADFQAGRLKWQYQRPFAAVSSHGARLTIYNDELVDSNIYVTGGAASLQFHRGPGNGLVVASGPNPDNETYAISFRPGTGNWTALGVQVIQDESLPGNRLARGSDRFVLTEVEARISADGKLPATKAPFVLATTNGFGETGEHPPMAAIDGDARTGWGQDDGDGKSPFLALRFARPVKTGPTAVITVYLRQNSPVRRATIGRIRLALSSGQYSWPQLGDAGVDAGLPLDTEKLPRGGVHDGVPGDVLKAIKASPASRSKEQAQTLRGYFQWSQPDLQSALIPVERLKAERLMLQSAIPTVLVSVSVQPRETRILPRANWMDDSGKVVQPAVPMFLGKLDTGSRRASRLDFANWLVSPENPLTARVFANRMWQQFFGTGLSKVLNDLGSQGEWPSHPELLDWLASEFMQPTWQAEGTHPWDVKHLIRTVVMSDTYRQSSLSNPELEGKDPDNRLLARQSRFRVGAEVVHDIALSLSGLLVEKFGGPSVKPYQPELFWSALNFPKRDYSVDHGEDLYRRGVYIHWQRTFLHPSLAAFDASSREECTVNRVNSNTPLQALVLLNDPIFVEAARVFAQNALKKGGPTLNARISWAFMQALGRTPAPDERQILANLYRKSYEDFRANPQRAVNLLQVGEAPVATDLRPNDLAAMTMVTRAIVNLHETITRN
ncbi:MAG: hypothetical protein DMG24_00945 [Acidobacteria bacterium]|nr:MAG: hypothetical protein DMG24_00945 [Acidobacteriota bacterium]